MFMVSLTWNTWILKSTSWAGPTPAWAGPKWALPWKISNKYRCFKFLGPKSTLLLHTLLDHGATTFAICALRLFFQNSTLFAKSRTQEHKSWSNMFPHSDQLWNRTDNYIDKYLNLSFLNFVCSFICLFLYKVDSNFCLI